MQCDTILSDSFEMNDQFALISLERLQSLTESHGRLSGVEIGVANLEDVPSLIHFLKDHLSAEYLVQSWKETHLSTFEAFHIQKRIFSLVIFVLVILALFNLMSLSSLRILGQRKQVAILHALGVDFKTLRMLFFSHTLLLGSMALVASLFLSLFLTQWIDQSALIQLPSEVYFVKTLPMQLDWKTSVKLVGIAWGCLFVTAYWSAKRVSQLPVLQVLGKGY